MAKALILILSLGFLATLLACGRRVGLPLDWRQIESLTVFAGLIIGMLLFEQHRLAIALSAVVAVAGFGLLTFRQFVAAAELDVILFLLGTFLVAGYLEESLFFEHIASQIVRRVGPRPGVLLAVLMLAAMIASSIVGEVAAILFVGGAMLHISKKYQLQPIPFLVMLVFATNVGSAATAFGPVGVTIAIKAHLSVLDFFRWATPIALAVLALVLAISRWWFAWDFDLFAQAVLQHHAIPSVPDPTHGSSAPAGWMLVISMTALLIFHAQIEQWLGLAPDAMLLIAALGAGVIALLLSGRKAVAVITHRVDWATLAFFLLLFIVVGSLQATGVTDVAARAILHGTRGNPTAMVLSVGWATGLLSAFLSNMLAVATFIPVVSELNAHGAACPTAVYWLMLFGATFMGNMTSIGSTCNIIACGMAERRGHGTIYFLPWLKIGLIVSLASMLLATLLLAVQTGWLSRG
jgi:Na+/H+ antiporter NhaD/arsenite permease-like protein